MSKPTFVLVPLLAVIILLSVWFFTSSDSLVVYCAHDAVYSKEILDEFTRRTGIPVQIRFDTEATKSLGLINLIVQERNQPRCDVFWNNELLGMVELKEQGLLEPYQGEGWKRIPDRFRDSEGYWTGFASRMRVAIFNTQQVSAEDETFRNLISFETNRVAIAKPLFGTTLTHYTVLWHLWGGDQLKEWHHDLKQRGLRIVDGNAAVKDVVALGACAAGLTDTDDAFVALDDGQPVAMLPAKLPLQPPTVGTGAAASGGEGKADGQKKDVTVCIPNTVGIIQGTKRRSQAERLVDYLTSADVELDLARAKSRQVPLGPVDESRLPDEVKRLIPWASDAMDLRSLLPARRDCLKWLQEEFLK